MSTNSYKIPSVEKVINQIIAFIFYYRLFFVLLAIGIISFLAYKVYVNSDKVDKLKNVAIVLTGGSIIIGIFYSIINYEHNQVKFNHDKKSTRDMLTFNTACKMQNTDVISHAKNVKIFYLSNKSLFTESKHLDISNALSDQEPIRISFIALFNYFEGIAIAIDQGIIDEVFMKKFFKSLFRDYHNFYNSHFEYIRKENNSPETFLNFTKLAVKWINES